MVWMMVKVMIVMMMAVEIFGCHASGLNDGEDDDSNEDGSWNLWLPCCRSLWLNDGDVC